MYTQNTPVHVKLWHRDFWLMAFANMFITTAVYMQIPLLSAWFADLPDFSWYHTAGVMGIFGLGMFALGCFCSYLIQHYRRNKVCVKAVLAVALSFCILYYLHKSKLDGMSMFAVLLTVRFLQGAAFGLAQMVLLSTLIIDTCESFQRTEANHSSSWFSRLALALGPALAIWLMPIVDFGTVIFVSVMLCLAAVVFILMVKIPFKAPEDGLNKISLDRFFLPRGKWLFINLVMITTVMGVFLALENTLVFYGMLMVGFVFALLSQRFVFVNAELKSEITSGLILIISALLLHFSGNASAVSLFSPVLIGCGMGIIGARFLLFFIKLSDHCQRGTSQSTFILAWESGLSLGLFAGYGFFLGNPEAAVTFSLILSFAALLMYVAFTHTWYIKNKNR